MNKCSKCGRPLNESENDLCPACKSDDEHKKKRWIKIFGAVVVVGYVLERIFKGRKGGDSA